MAHPAFSEIPDPTVAEICSEGFEDDYVFSVTTAVAEKYGTMELYTGAAVLLVATACYIDLERRTIGSVFAPTQRISRADAPDASRLYREGVGVHQGEVFDLVAAPVVQFGGNVDGIQGWGVRGVVESGRRLVAAHVVTRQMEDGELTGALIFPRSFAEELPLLMRSDYTKLLKFKDQLPDASYRAAFDKITGPVLHNEKVAGTAGDMLAASFLPTPEQNDSSLGI